jgi:hypothetical protein
MDEPRGPTSEKKKKKQQQQQVALTFLPLCHELRWHAQPEPSSVRGGPRKVTHTAEEKRAILEAVGVLLSPKHLTNHPPVSEASG